MVIPDDKFTFPDFMCVGPHRTGTTWLHKTLRQHPRIYVPSWKEVHFFCDHEFRPNRFQRRIHKDIRVYSAMYSSWRSKLLDPYLALKSLTNSSTNLVLGDIGPCYAIAEESVISRITTLNSQLKVILNIRDSVERAWSHVCNYYLKRGVDPRRLPRAKLDGFLHGRYILRAGRTGELIAKWRRYVPPERLFLLQFEKLQREPQVLLTELLDFLGAGPLPRQVRLRWGKIETPTLPMPDDVRATLVEMFAVDLSRADAPQTGAQHR